MAYQQIALFTNEKIRVATARLADSEPVYTWEDFVHARRLFLSLAKQNVVLPRDQTHLTNHGVF